MYAIIPSKWKESFITPIPKCSTPKVCADYRPISITFQICRIYERFLKGKILAYLDSIHFFNHAQHGFRPYRSTTTQMVDCLNDWTSALDENIQTDII